MADLMFFTWFILFMVIVILNVWTLGCGMLLHEFIWESLPNSFTDLFEHRKKHHK
jgi:hypothetical protein